MKFRELDLLLIKTELSNLAKTLVGAKKFTDEMLAKFASFESRLRYTKATLDVSWIDQIGKRGESRIGAQRVIKMITSTIEVIDYIERSNIYNNGTFASSMKFALLMKENIDGIGASRAMIFKAVFDGCSQSDAVRIHIMDSIFEAGKHTWGQAPWENSEGHTIWTPVQAIQTIMFAYGYDQKTSADLLRELTLLGLIANEGGHIFVPAIRKIEKQIANWVGCDGGTIKGLECDFSGLNEDQARVLEALTNDQERVCCIIGPGGTGKTHTVSRYIKGLIEVGRNVLCCAPTGIASKVLNDALKGAGVDTTSLVQNGVVVLDRAIALARFGMLGADVLVIDEASMVSVNHLSLISLLGDDLERMVLLGDPSQLRPVEAGQPFKDLISKPEKVKILELYKNMRANNSALVAELDQVRAGVGIIHRIIPMASSAFVKDQLPIRDNPESVDKAQRDQLARWIESTIDKGYVWLGHTNILCRALTNYAMAYKHGYTQDVKDIYLLDVVAAYFGAKNHKYAMSPSLQVEGMEVYWNAERHGEKVRIYRGYSGVIRGQYVRMNALDLETNNTVHLDLLLEQYEGKIMPWMVKTVHKSQGQSLTNVIYLIKTLMGGKHNLELAYTAHSRAKESVLVVSLCNEAKFPRLNADADRETTLGISL